MRIFIFSCVFLFILLLSCKPNHTAKTSAKDFPKIFSQVLDAHGGYDRWQSMNTLVFDLSTEEYTETHTIDLKTRKSVIDREGKFRLGFNGEDVWITPHRDSFPGSSLRFYHNLHFYFAAIPFVFMDPGVNMEYLGYQKVNDIDYHVLLVTFGENVGDAPDDKYYMYVNPNSFIVDFILYSVTYFDPTRANNLNALLYFWQKVDGITVPFRYAGHVWNNGSFGAQRNANAFSNIRLSGEVMDPSFFDPPEGAFVE